MTKYLKYILPIIFAAAIALGLYQWQFNSPSQQYLQRQDSNRDSLDDYYNPEAKQSHINELTFLAVGDIMLSRNVAGAINKAGKDGFLPFRNLDELLSGTDFNFGNLESPFSGSDQYIFNNEFIFNAPTWARSGLNQYNFKVLSLANNHIFNHGKAGMDYTINYLSEVGLKGVGAGDSIDEAWHGQTFSAKGVTVGFIAVVYPQGGEANKYVAQISNDTTRLAGSITELKTRSDFVVVSMHAGEEYTRQPNQQQIDFAHAAIDAGADMVVGAHTHWIQTTESYKGKYIFYGLGNFVFDQEWSQDTKQGLTLKITLTKPTTCEIDKNASRSSQQAACADDLQGPNVAATIKQIELIPVIIENYSTPRLATEAEKTSILKKINVTNSTITPN